MSKAFFAGIAFWACAAGVFYSIRPKSRLHKASMAPFDRRKLIIMLAVMLAVILLCTLPMSLSPFWNGENTGHRNQYEKITEAFLHGHLYFDDEADYRLAEMDNPYDPAARDAAGVTVQWDHAYYNGRYYMYFGVVPVFLLFLPFRLLTGASLTAYHATQIFVAAFICGLFAVFYLLCRKFFQSMSFAAYLVLASAFAVMSIWYCTASPALYCTAISAALCMEVWSLYCFMRAVWIEEDVRRGLRWAFFGSLFGALVFGCRPPIALANLLVLPLLAEYLRTPPKKRFRDLALAAAPYFVIGILLMLYNYLRFDSPFEFGQTYQLTSADQSNYGLFGNDIRLLALINAILLQLFRPTQFSLQFPYVSFQSFFGNFPILLFSLWGLLDQGLRSMMKRLRLWSFYLTAMAISLSILVVEIIYSPGFLERYRTDLYWLLALAAFIAFGCQFLKWSGNSHSADDVPAKQSSLVCFAGLLTFAVACLYFLLPWDLNYTEVFPEALQQIESVLRLGF